MKKKMITSVLLLVTGLLSGLVSACSPQETKLTVYVAVSVKAPVSQLVETYQQQHPNITLEASYGTAPVLAKTVRSLKQGDILIGRKSDIDSMDNDGLIVLKHPLTTMTPVALVPKDSSLVSSWEDLAKEGVRIGIVNPSLGGSAQAIAVAIDKSPLADKINANITALGLGPQDTVKLLQDGVVDVVLLPKEVNTKQFKVIDIPADINQVIKVGIAVPRYTTNEDQAKAFAEFMIGEEARKVFQKMGYQVTE